MYKHTPSPHAYLQRVSKDEAKTYARSVGALYFETSAKAKDGLVGIQLMFTELARAMPASVIQPTAASDEIPNLRAREPKDSKGGCAC